MPSLRLISFLLAAGVLAGCGPRSSVTDLSSATPASPATPTGDPTADATDTSGDTPSAVVNQARKAHGLVSHVRPRHRRVLPR